jgi:hypothetical protein
VRQNGCCSSGSLQESRLISNPRANI